MNALESVRKHLSEAQDNLQELQAELPNFQRLLTDNQAEERKLREGKAPLDDIAKAKGRVNVARELLEQHQADLATAQAEVTRLEAKLQREHKLERMANNAREATRCREAFNTEMANANEAVKAHLQRMLFHLNGIIEARRAFTLQGQELSEAFRHHYLAGDIKSNQIRAEGHAVLKQLEERGAPLSDVRAQVGAKLSAMDRDDAQTLINPAPYGALLWEAIQQAQEEQRQAAQVREREAQQARDREHARKREEERRKNNYEVSVVRWQQATVEDLVFRHASHFRYTGSAEELATWTIPKANLPDGFIDNLKKQLPRGATVR